MDKGHIFGHDISLPVSGRLHTISGHVHVTGHVEEIGEKRNVMLLVGKPEGKRPPGRPRHRWRENIKIDF
jgi:hypothetical protein